MHTMKRNRQRGGTLLESALTLIVFLALFIGVFDVGEMLFIHQTLTDRARNAARWGAVNTFDATTIQNLVLYGATAPAAGQIASFGLAASNVTVTRPAISVGTPEDRVVVTIVYRVSLISASIGQAAASSVSSVPTWNLQIQVSTPYEVPG
jgi:Flp pilus assembly protein TadG